MVDSGNSCIWVLLLIALLGGRGFGGVEAGATTKDAVYEAQSVQNINNGIEAIQNGMCQMGYENKNGVSQTLSAIKDFQTAMGNALCTTEYRNLELFNKVDGNLSKFACDVLRGQDGINYNLATQTDRIIKNNDDNTDKILMWLNNDRAERQAKENAELRQKLQTIEIINANKNCCGYSC